MLMMFSTGQKLRKINSLNPSLGKRLCVGHVDYLVIHTMNVGMTSTSMTEIILMVQVGRLRVLRKK